MQLNRTWQGRERLNLLVEQIKGFSEVEDVEYSQAWLHRISVYATFFRLASLIIGGLVAATAIFVSANTIRLTLYANRDELEIMRLVGATDSFIKAPFYMHNLFEGFLGGAIALGVLFASYKVFAAKLQAPEVLLGPVQIRFLSLWGTGALLLIGMAMAWLGSYFSLKQSLKP
jgi:cell division transport system permease protein